MRTIHILLSEQDDSILGVLTFIPKSVLNTSQPHVATALKLLEMRMILAISDYFDIEEESIELCNLREAIADLFQYNTIGQLEVKLKRETTILNVTKTYLY